MVLVADADAAGDGDVRLDLIRVLAAAAGVEVEPGALDDADGAPLMMLITPLICQPPNSALATPSRAQRPSFPNGRSHTQ